MNMNRYFMILAAALLMCACGGNGKGGSLKPTSSGRPYEILLVADAAHFQDGLIDSLTSLLKSPVPGLPQEENAFDVSKVTEDQYFHNLRYCRNIINLNIDRTFTTPKIKFSRDVYSSPQMVMTMQAPDSKSLMSYLGEHGQEVIDFFTRAEMNREIDLLKGKHNEVVTKTVREMFGCDVWVPIELGKTKVGKDFFWASTDRGQRDMNFVVYSYPYTDVETFTEEYCLAKRDSVMKANIPGPREGQYMETARPFVDVIDSELRGRYAQEARGLWRMKNYDMGGPFVSLSRVDEKNGRVIVAEGFVYAPGDNKKHLMRRMEASVYSLQLPDEIDERKFSYAIEEIVVKPENE